MAGRGLPSQPMLLPYLLHFRSRRGAILILTPRCVYPLHLPEALAHVAGWVLSRVDGQCTLAQLLEMAEAELAPGSSEAVLTMLAYLQRRGWLVDGAVGSSPGCPTPTWEHWNRNLSFFSGFEREGWTRCDGQASLQGAAVALIGLGGTGSWAAYSLAMAGLGRMVGVDGDHVEMSNLNRQVLYRPQDVGRPKAQAATEALAAVAPGMAFLGLERSLRGEQDVMEVVEGCDLVLLASDQPMGWITRWANAACFARRIPFLQMGIAAQWGLVGPLYVPGLTGCCECVEAQERRQSPYYEEIFETRAERPVSAPPSLAPLCALVGGLAAYEAIAYLTGFARPAALGCELALDTLTLQVERHAVRQRAGCPTCHVPPQEMPLRAVDLPKANSYNPFARLWQTVKDVISPRAV